MDFKSYIREVPDFPKPGIMFKDITPLLSAPGAFTSMLALMSAGYDCNKIAALDARGFIFGAAMAIRFFQVPFVPIRKKGKLPWKTESVSYDLEYGSNVLEVHADAFREGDNVLVVDDLLATGGTALAACQLIERLGARVAGCTFAIELADLGGRKLLAKYDVSSILSYGGESNDQ